jgi:quercetin dioxygenase-like cupin family protein
MKDVPGVAMGAAAPGVTKQVLIGPADGAPTFAMRCFTIAPGGATPWHKHDWEHEVAVVEGEGAAVGPEGETPVGRGHVVFVPPNEMHQFRNTGAKDFAMVCLVPLRGEK